MLWIVTQTEMTLSTGDHSLPRMDAHICTVRTVSCGPEPCANSAQQRQHCGGRAYMAVRVYVLRREVSDVDCGRRGSDAAYGVDGRLVGVVDDELHGGRGDRVLVVEPEQERELLALRT